MGQVREAFEYIAESVNFMTSVYGAIHPELSQGLRSLARLSYILGDNAEALSQQHKATLISERCNGLDHSTTIQEYIHLAHYAFGNLFITAALRLLYRARYLLLIAHGEKHPVMTQIDVSSLFLSLRLSDCFSVSLSISHRISVSVSPLSFGVSSCLSVSM